MRAFQCARTDAHSKAECRDYRGPKVFKAPEHGSLYDAIRAAAHHADLNAEAKALGLDKRA